MSDWQLGDFCGVRRLRPSTELVLRVTHVAQPMEVGTGGQEGRGSATIAEAH